METTVQTQGQSTPSTPSTERVQTEVEIEGEYTKEFECKDVYEEIKSIYILISMTIFINTYIRQGCGRREPRGVQPPSTLRRRTGIPLFCLYNISYESG